MLSLDTRMVGDCSALLSVAPTTYSPLTPTNLEQAFAYEGINLTATVAYEPVVKHEMRSSSSCDDASLVGFDFGNDLPALSVEDSCSPATSPASSWMDDAHSATTPDPPALDSMAATEPWNDQSLFAAPLDKDRQPWWATETVTDGSEKAWTSQHMSNMDRSTNAILGVAPELPHSKAGASSVNHLVAVSSNPPGSSSNHVLDFVRQGGLDANSVAGFTCVGAEFDHFKSDLGIAVSAGKSATPVTAMSGAPLTDRADRSFGDTLPFDSTFGTFPDLSLDVYMAHYSQFGRRGGTSPVLESRRPALPAARQPLSALRQERPEQQQHTFYQQQLYAPPQAALQTSPSPFGAHVPPAGVVSAANPGYVPVQFTTATGATYAVAIPIAASNQAAAIETPHGTYYFVPSPPAPAPALPAAPTTQVPLGAMQTPPSIESPLPQPPPFPEPLLALPPLSLPPTGSDLDATSPPPAAGVVGSKKSPATSRRPRKASTKTAKQRSITPDFGEPVQAAGVEPAKSDSFQLPQGPSAAQIAAENAAKAAARVAALDPTHKIRLPVGQGKRGSTKRKADSGNSGSNKKDQSRRFNCPHPGCGRGFARNFNMQSHYKSHLGVREYDCPWCTKKFSRRHDRARHCTGVHDAIVDREGNITGPHPVLNKEATRAVDDDDDIDAEGDYDYEHYQTNAIGSPEERDSYGRGSIASVSTHLD